MNRMYVRTASAPYSATSASGPATLPRDFDIFQPPVEGRPVVARIDVPQEVPRRVDEGVHRVGLAAGPLSALRAIHVQPFLVRGQRRDALRPVIVDLGQQDRQVLV